MKKHIASLPTYQTGLSLTEELLVLNIEEVAHAHIIWKSFIWMVSASFFNMFFNMRKTQRN